MITSNGKFDTDSAEPKTLLDVSGDIKGWVKIWTFDPASGAGTLTINGQTVEIDAGEFSDSFPLKSTHGLTITLTRSGDTNMTGWQAMYNRAD